MSQYDFGTITASTKTGSALASDLNSWRTGLHSLHAGTSRPSYAIAGLLWLDTNTTPWVLKLYDGADDITLGTLNAGSNLFLAQNAARSGANSDITSLTGVFTTPLGTANGGTGASSVGAMISGQTADTAPDVAADYVLSYDTSASSAKKVPMNALPTLGMAQTWQDKSGSRSAATNYQNTTGRAIMISVRGNNGLALYVGSASPASSLIDYYPSGDGAVQAIIPPGWWYRVTVVSGAIAAWWEMTT